MPDWISNYATALIAALYHHLPKKTYGLNYIRHDVSAGNVRVRANLPDGRYETRASIIFGDGETTVRFMGRALQNRQPKTFPRDAKAEEVARTIVHEFTRQRKQSRGRHVSNEKRG